MRKSFPLVFICLYGAVATAQNVGIGTSTPLNKLHIAGGLRLDTLVGVGGSGLLWHNSSGVVYGLKFTGNTNDVLRGDGSFAPSSGGGAGYWSANGNNIYNNNTGLVGIGTQTPGAGLELRGTGLQTQQRITDNVSGNSLVLQGGADENLKITGYNYGTGIAKPLYLSVDGANTIINPHGGNIGIGTASPSFTVDIKTPTFGGGTRTISNGAANFIVQTNGGTNSWARYYMRSTNRSWFIGTSQNFNGDQLYINDETAGQTRMVINTGGNVGIGTTNPLVKLHVNGTGSVESSVQSTNERAILSLNSTIGGQNRVWTLENGVFGNAGQFAIYDRTAGQARLSIQPAGPINVQGNVTQNLGSYGLPKAMLYVNGDGTIINCYNALTNNSSGGCGFTVTKTSQGYYHVNLGFALSTRFISVSLQNGGTGRPVTIAFEPGGSNIVDVLVYFSDEGDGATFENTVGTDRPFMLIVF
jgi:hypothetical protein